MLGKIPWADWSALSRRDGDKVAAIKHEISSRPGDKSIFDVFTKGLSREGLGQQFAEFMALWGMAGKTIDLSFKRGPGLDQHPPNATSVYVPSHLPNVSPSSPLPIVN